MTVFVCIDDNGGLTFNGRRQSRDSALIKDVATHTDDGVLYINEFSELLFEDSEASVISVSSPLDSAYPGGYAFVENLPLSQHKNKINRLVIYKWNRRYPSDKKLDISPAELKMHLVESYDFPGTSHDKITKEIYER
ncbi:MAG: ribonuclease Z [Clostridia bacterium]|nr:ribonuclease Z [Clostridia bacterium]